MSLPAAVVLVVLFLAGIAMLSLGLRRVQHLLEFRRNSVLLSARQLPDNVKPQLFGGASLQAAVYQRQASFYCPLTKKKRIAIERVASSRQSRWEEGRRIAVRVCKHPPHEALVATFRNLYLFPITYVAVGTGLAFVLPLAILNAWSSGVPAGR